MAMPADSSWAHKPWWTQPIPGRVTERWTPKHPERGYAHRHYWPSPEAQRRELAELLGRPV